MLTFIRSLLFVVTLFILQGCYIEITDDNEGDSLATASYLDMSYGNVSYAGSFDNEWDRDVFRLVISERGSYHFWSSGADNDIEGYLYSAGGDIIASDTNHSGNGVNFSFYQYLYPGTYYLSLEGYYGYYVTHAELDDTFDDVGNTLNTNTMSLSLSYGVAGEIDYQGDVDVFKFVVDKSDFYQFQSAENLDTYGYLYAADGELISCDDDSGQGDNFSMVEYLYAGTYYLSVQAYNPSDTGIYVVYVDRVQ